MDDPASPTFPPPPSPNPRASTPEAAVSAPIRRDDYASDEEDELVYAAPPPGRTRPRHKSTPSTTGLLGAEDAETAAGIPLAEGYLQARLRDYSLGGEGEEGRVSRVLRGIAGRCDGAAKLFRRNEGFLLIVGSQALFACVNTCIKLLQDLTPIPTWELIAVRMSVTWLGCVGYMRWAKVPHPFLGPPGVRLLLCLRGVVGFLGLFGMYFSLKYLSLSDATVLSFISPVLVGVLAAILLKETYTKAEALTGVFSLFGVVLIAKPSFLFGASGVTGLGPGGAPITMEQRSLAVATAMVGVLGSAGAYLTIRTIGTRANAIHSISYFSLYSVVVSCAYPLFFDSPPVFIWDIKFVLLLFPIGIMGFFAQALLTTGLQREKAGRGTLAIYSLLLFAMILERLVFGVLPDSWSLFGSSIIIGGAIYVVLQKNSTDPQTVHRGRSAPAAGGNVERKVEEGRAGDEGDESEERIELTDQDQDIHVVALPSGSGSGER